MADSTKLSIKDGKLASRQAHLENGRPLDQLDSGDKSAKKSKHKGTLARGHDILEAEQIALLERMPEPHQEQYRKIIEREPRDEDDYLHVTTGEGTLLGEDKIAFLNGKSRTV
jgi:hypothetical protein